MFVYVGGFTTPERNGRANGITVFHAAGPGVAWTEVQTLATLDNPSLLRIAPSGRMLYAVHGDRSAVSAYAIDPAHGTLTPSGSQDCGGTNPVDLGFVPGSSAMVVANYTSGTVAVLPIAPDGTLQPPSQTITLSRPGVDNAPLPHGVTFDASGRFVLIPDKGLDCVFVFRTEASGTLSRTMPAFAPCEPGSGPRHAVFHPQQPVFYVLNELACTVQVFQWDGVAGILHPLQVASTLPRGSTGDSFAAAEIAISRDGRALYASNRGHNSIAQFDIDDGGLLGPGHCTPSLGKEPRLFAIAPGGHALHVANQESDTIVAFPLDESGRLLPGTALVRVGSPTAICYGGL